MFPYPLQNHLGYLSKEVRTTALVEMLTAPKSQFRTMEEWLVQSFGPTLTDAFFGPFHEFYTAGLWKRIAPQDPYKSPVDAALVIRGASEATPPVGYNTSYIYPQEGLNALAQGMAEGCDIHYGKRVMRVDIKAETVLFEDGTQVRYESLLSTLPLNKMVEMTGLEAGGRTRPLHFRAGFEYWAVRGAKCPGDHWIYLPGSRAGFHRVGFYSNVDVSFLPRSSRASNNRVSIYVERAYLGGQKPSPEAVAEYSEATVRELQEWGFIEDAEVVDPTWIDVAYTWSWPGSKWRAAALKALEEHDIIMVGRYGRWIFQGIADSIRDGLFVGASAQGASGPLCSGKLASEGFAGISATHSRLTSVGRPSQYRHCSIDQAAAAALEVSAI